MDKISLAWGQIFRIKSYKHVVKNSESPYLTSKFSEGG